eukprot:scaffold95526_cov63-Phaeocystis_antarctica.AAC.5
MVLEERVVHGALLIVHGALPGEDEALVVLLVGAQLVGHDECLVAHDDHLGDALLLCGRQFDYAGKFDCTCSKLFFLQQRGEAAGGGEVVRVADAERVAQPLLRLAVQRPSGGEVVLLRKQRGESLGAGEVALGPQQRAEVADGAERARILTAEGLALPLQRLAKQRLSGGEVALGFQHHAEVPDRDERARVKNAERLALPL